MQVQEFIEMLNKDEAGNKMVYSEELYIEVGETITWLPTSKDTMLNGLLVLTEQNFQRSLRIKEVSMTFEVLGTTICALHTKAWA